MGRWHGECLFRSCLVPCLSKIWGVRGFALRGMIDRDDARNINGLLPHPYIHDVCPQLLLALRVCYDRSADTRYTSDSSTGFSPTPPSIPHLRLPPPPKPPNPMLNPNPTPPFHLLHHAPQPRLLRPLPLQLIHDPHAQQPSQQMRHRLVVLYWLGPRPETL